MSKYYVVENDGNGVSSELLSIEDIFNRGMYQHTFDKEFEKQIIEPIFVFRSKEDAELYKQASSIVANVHDDAEGNEHLKFVVKQLKLSKETRKLLEEL